jgi:uncharacterized protein YbjT (DUF2867 family)
MILVTGASGTAGRAVVSALAERQAERAVAVATRASRPKPGERRFDYSEPATWAPALAGVSAIFLMLPPGLPKARRVFASLLAEARGAGVQRVTFLSVRNADRLAFLPHRGIEKEVEACGLGWTHLRPNDWMQNFATQPLYRNDIASGELWLPNGRSRSSYIDVRDVAAVAAVTLNGGYDGQALPLTGPEELTADAVAATFAAELGRPVVNRAPSLLAFIRHALRQGTPGPLAAIMGSIGLIARTGLAKGVDPTIERLLGRPPTSFASFVADHRATWQSAAGTAGSSSRS